MPDNLKKIILFGAYDRYNYGDNLMPIVLEQYIRKYHGGLLDSYELVNSALFRSDLSKYGCLPTTPYRDSVNSIPDNSILIVVGGEVVGARSLVLYSHTIRSKFTSYLLKKLSRRLGLFGEWLGSIVIGIGFILPFTPPKPLNSRGVRICYSSAGGNIPKANNWIRRVIIDRLRQAHYISFRDDRCITSLEGVDLNVNLSPDSVAVMPILFSRQFILDRVRDKVKEAVNEDYFVFQCSPYKVSANPQEVSDALIEASKRTGRKFILLPIGYASGHDDAIFLRKVSALSGLDLLEDLNIWEIVFVIMESKGYWGTSLHGAITAIAYCVPHFAVGNVSKLKEYLDKWSAPPFQGLNSIHDIPALATASMNCDTDLLRGLSNQSICHAKNNIDKMIDCASVAK